MGSVTLKDLAAKLDLSITTVSRALGGYGDVAESTRRRVLQAAEETGTSPMSLPAASAQDAPIP